jgi:hypothetical protein
VSSLTGKQGMNESIRMLRGFAGAWITGLWLKFGMHGALS